MKIDKLAKILKKYDLVEYLDILLYENPSNNRPYHNLYHILCVTDFCYKIGKDCGLNDRDLRTLMLAALFHDFGYYSKVDSENIIKAIEYFKEYSHESEYTNKNVVKIIQATQYPYVIDEANLNMSQKIIRDADLLQWTKKNFIDQVLFGLSKEMDMPLNKFVVGQKNFMLGMTFYTSMGQSIYDNNITKKLKDLEEFSKTNL